MSQFFGDNVLLYNESAKALYQEVKDLPIIDYHCHLDQTKIKADTDFPNIGALWLAGDHYKWRSMRLNGVDEYYITGGATWEEKFMKYAEIVPKLIGGPVYYWTHFELKQIFGINKPLNKDTAKEIYEEANKKLADLSVRKMLDLFKVEYVATTDDPIDDLMSHGKHGNTQVSPTFRPDKIYALDDAYLAKLSAAAQMPIESMADVKEAVTKRLDYFVSKGCKISDHGFADFPKYIPTDEEAEELFKNRASLTVAQKDMVFGYLLAYLMKEYKKRNIVVQLHFAVTRNINKELFEKLGADIGCDVIAPEVDLNDVIAFLKRFSDEERPTTILYTLNPNTIAPLACISGAYRNVYIGAAWWFNDTLNGIRRNLDLVSEYACLGTNLGMLTDSRAFSSYSRFDFFRRILCQFVGDLVEKGEYCMEDAKTLVKDISYYNIKNLLKI